MRQLTLSIVVAMLVATGTVMAQNYPLRPIRMLVPFAPVKTPRAVIDRVFRDSVAAMKELEAEGALARRQLPIVLSASPKEFDDYVRSEAKRWEKIIKDNNLRID